MKKQVAVFLICILILMCFSGASLADPTETPNSESTLISLGASGEIVVRIQLRLLELGYLNFKPTGNFQGLTVNAVKQYQQTQVKTDGSAMIADGTVGSETLGLLFQSSAARAAIPVQIHIPFGPSKDSSSGVEAGQIVSWSTMKEQLSKNGRYEITDYNTGKTFSVTYFGGEQHAEVECTTVSDTEVYKEVFGGEFNYSKRPVIITVNGTRIAASLQGQPHGEDLIAGNGMSGHACLFFEGSLSHVGSLPDTEHLKQVYIAAGR